MSVQFTSTNTGRAKLAASGVGTVTAATIKISPDAQTVTEDTTDITNIVASLAISGESVSDGQIHIAAADSSNAEYSARTIGIYLDDGTLFAVYSQSDAIFEKVSGTDQLIAFDAILVDVAATEIVFPDTVISNPPATTTKKGVIEIADGTEILAGTDTEKAVVPAQLKAYIDHRIQQGIDAATLGGQNKLWFADIIARLGYTPLQASDIAGMWTSNNDGPNSGLVADKLWDKSPDDFALIGDFVAQLQTNGYVKIPLGGTENYDFYLQWCVGQSVITIDTSQLVTFPIAFPHTCLFSTVSTKIMSNVNADPNYQIVGSPTKTGVTVRRQAVNNEGNDGPSAPLVLAIGY